MGCAAGTLIEDVGQYNATLKAGVKDGDVNPLTRTTADSGDLSNKNAAIFGDRFEHNEEATIDGTNFHNSPTNVVENHASLSNGVDIKSEIVENVSTTVSIIPNDDDTQPKTADTFNNQGELQREIDATNCKLEEDEHLSGNVPRSTLNISDEERLRLIANLSPELTKQLEMSLTSRLQHADLINGDHDKRNFVPHSLISNGLLQEHSSNKLPHLDSSTVHNKNFPENVDNNNQNDQYYTFVSHKQHCCSSGKIEMDVDLLVSSDLSSNRLISKNNMEKNHSHDFLTGNSLLPRISPSYLRSRQSHISPILNNEEVNESFEKDILDNQ